MINSPHRLIDISQYFFLLHLIIEIPKYEERIMVEQYVKYSTCDRYLYAVI